MLAVICSTSTAETRIRCASTTSTLNSGFFDYILPIFKQKTGISIDVVAVGTGAALEIGKRGDADFVFVHSKDDELRLEKEGWFVGRKDVMYNDFVLVGPKGDPAKVKGSSDAITSIKKIAVSGVPFASRGDESGTHKKELELWKKAGIDPKSNKNYLSTGSGMEKTLRVADEKTAYCLTDRGTWLAFKPKSTILDIVFEGDPSMFNQYGVMAVNPQKHKHVKFAEAKVFMDWITSKEGQSAIASFKDKQGNQLFYPNAK